MSSNRNPTTSYEDVEDNSIMVDVLHKELSIESDGKVEKKIMSSNRDPTISYEDVEDNSITMVDVLHEELSIESDVNALLGAADDKNCSYSLGYVGRQALYSCLTCIPKSSNVMSGICLACSYHCHEGHKLLELYTKRNFRCDCGNDLFGSFKCNLESNKEPTNKLNIYNQNFKGLYCKCNRPYPDEEDNVPDEMIQCIICEDWYHSRHLEAKIPENYNEMICYECVNKNAFLSFYSNEKLYSEIPSNSPNHVCILGNIEISAKSLFLPSIWRKKLCQCNECLKTYKEKKLEFLLDNQDTVEAYEKKGQDKGEVQSQYEKGMEALSSLDRIQQIEAIGEYNVMKDKLKEYLQKFAENKKVVREEDIREFFTKLGANKKQKLEPPAFCH